VHGPSQIIDAASFAWTDAAWKGIPRDDLVIYELHIGSFSLERLSHGWRAVWMEISARR
jgi:maltooligosyltrehalose trehalohydrolase